jgi:hypothetical protein
VGQPGQLDLVFEDGLRITLRGIRELTVSAGSNTTTQSNLEQPDNGATGQGLDRPRREG